jgi:ribonuclease HII
MCRTTSCSSLSHTLQAVYMISLAGPLHEGIRGYDTTLLSTLSSSLPISLFHHSNTNQRKTQEDSCSVMHTTEAERGHVTCRVRFVIGVDEAGRGCMAGPVGVAAALYRLSANAVAYDVSDSKKMSEAARETTLDVMCAELGLTSSDVFLSTVIASGECYVGRYQRIKPLQAVAAKLVDVSVINERNILNATLEGMAAVCHTLVQMYNRGTAHPITPKNCAILIDGSRTPWTFMPEAQRQDVCNGASRREELRKRMGVVYPVLEGFSCITVVKGDDTLLSIAAASIVAKVARDAYVVRVMHPAYPHYGFDRHKGYCTTDHKQQVTLLGPCPFHRSDYAPVQEAMNA